MYGTGISKEGELLDLAVDEEVVEKSGTWFSYQEERLGQGRENVKRFFKENSDLLSKIEKKVREKLGLQSDDKTKTDEKQPVNENKK